MSEQRPPFPPFDEAAAQTKVLGAEAAWNTRDPERVAGAYSIDSEWRNRDTFLQGRTAIRDFLAQKWSRELDYALRKDLWAFTGNRIAVRFQYESLDTSGQWWRVLRQRELGVRRSGADATSRGIDQRRAHRRSGQAALWSSRRWRHQRHPASLTSHQSVLSNSGL